MSKIKLTIIDAVKLVKWKDVKRSIKYHYVGDKNDYEKLFYKLGKMKKVKVKKGESLEVQGGIDLDSEWGRKYGEKHLEDMITGVEQEYYGIHINKVNSKDSYSLSFVKWNYLASLPILPDTVNHYNLVDIIAHFIWEITFYGTEKDAKKVADTVFSRAKDAVKQKKKEKKKK